jgi:hypothetical protein
VLLAGCLRTTGSAGTEEVKTVPTLDRLISPDPAPVKDSFCLWAEAIYWSKDDTPETIEQVKRKHNVPYVTLCKPNPSEAPH